VNATYLRAKYPKMSDDAIAAKLSSIAARNSALVGGTAGAAGTADEIITLASLGFSLPGSVAIAIGAVGVDIGGVIHIQLRPSRMNRDQKGFSLSFVSHGCRECDDHCA
jgi:hypothetical protein